MSKQRFIQSWKDLKNNLILFVPDIITLIINLILGFFFLKYSGLLSLITNPEIILSKVETSVPFIKLFFKENLSRIIISFAVFIITSFVIGSGLTAMKMSMMKDIIKRKKLTLIKLITNGKDIWKVVSMKMIMFVIGIITFLFALGITIILSTFIPQDLMTRIIQIFPFLMIMFLQIIFFFRYPIVFLDKKHPIIAVKNSVYYFINNKKYVLIVWLIVFSFSSLITIFNIALAFTKEKIILPSIILSIIYILSYIFQKIINVWSEMFKFRSYKTKLQKP